MDWENLVTSVIISDKTIEELKAEHQQLPHVRNMRARNIKQYSYLQKKNFNLL
jgi:hypothetical protein